MFLLTIMLNGRPVALVRTRHDHLSLESTALVSCCENEAGEKPGADF